VCGQSPLNTFEMKWSADCESLCLNGSKSLPQLEQQSSIKWKTSPEEQKRLQLNNMANSLMVLKLHTGVVFKRSQSFRHIV